jgi:anti-anti-sigma factor
MYATCLESAECTYVELRNQEEVLVLEVCGELGSLGWRAWNVELERAVASSLDDVLKPRMVVDLSGVIYAGAEFIEFLVGLRNRVHDAGGRLVLAGVRGNLRTMLRILHLDRILPRYPSPDAAVHAIRIRQD